MNTKLVAMGMISAWRQKVRWIRLGSGIALLKSLGDFNKDKVLIEYKGRGFHTIPAYNLLAYRSTSDYCVSIRPIYFKGGPTGDKLFKGTFRTMILDRVIYVAHEKGAEHVLELVKEAQNGTNNLQGSSTSNLTDCF